MRRHPALSAALLWLAAAATALAQPAPAGGARLVQDAAVTWRAADGAIGSLSGMIVLDGGARFLAVSDKGGQVEGRFLRADGRITGIERVASGDLHDPAGKPVRRYDIDAEGLTLGGDGRLYVSFEGNHRVWAYDRLDGPAEALPQPAAFRALQNNSGLEALFTGPDGSIHAIPERSGALERPYPVYRFDGDAWDVAFAVPRRVPHLVTGADLGPDGRLYLLERHWNGLLSFSTRVRSFRLGPRGVSDERILLESPLGHYDNLEGISVWRDAGGRIRVTLVSDDNANIFQRTEFIEFLLEPGSTLRAPRPRLRPGPDAAPTQ